MDVRKKAKDEAGMSGMGGRGEGERGRIERGKREGGEREGGEREGGVRGMRHSREETPARPRARRPRTKPVSTLNPAVLTG